MLFDADLAAAIASVEDQLHWARSPSYTDAVLGEGFADNYGWCHIIGPDGFFHGDDFLLGLLLLGPNRHYRDHFHPGPGTLLAADVPQPVETGRRAHSPKNRQATSSGTSPMKFTPPAPPKSPLLAVWAWTKDTATGAQAC